MADDKRGHVIPLWRVQGKTPKSLPERVEDGPCREGGIVAESCDQALGAELVVPSKDLGQSVGVKQQPRSGREGEADALINCALPSGCSGSSARPPLGCWGDSNTAGLSPALTISISALSGCS